MNSQSHFKKLLILPVVVAAALGVAGCDKQTSSGDTVGQKVDKAIDKTNTAVEQAGNKIEQTAKTAGDSIKSTADTVQQKAGEAGTVMDDSAITASIKADLLKEPGLSALKIDVNTVKGEVTLKGEAASAAAKDRAGQIAAAVNGVVKVNNTISVKG